MQEESITRAQLINRKGVIAFRAGDKTILELTAMLSKKEIKDIQLLVRKKERDDQGLFLAEGPKMVAELIEAAPGAILKVYALEEWIGSNKTRLQAVEHKAVSEEEMDRISAQKTPAGVLALVKIPQSKEPAASQEEWTLYLDTIQDPGNMGTIIRTADWFGVKNIICTEGCADPYAPKVVQSTMASILRINIFKDNGDWLSRQKEVKKYAAVLGGESLKNFSAKGGILLIGNESKGLSPELISMADHHLTITKRGNAESLNASVATGIILSHFLS